MSMSPEVRAEYEAALGCAAVTHGSVLKNEGRSQFSLYDYAATGHPATCETSVTSVEEDVWHEFAGTFATTNDTRRHGVVASGVTCACGLLTNRTVRWEASVSEITETLFTAVFERLRNLEENR